MSITIKRVYEPRGKDDGQRILVDRLWPRGLTKARAGVDLWLKDVAPSTELRKWFGHDPGKWAKFKMLYRAELKAHGEQVSLLKQAARKGTATLVYKAVEGVSLLGDPTLRGNTTLKVVPSSGDDETLTPPPCALRISLTM